MRIGQDRKLAHDMIVPAFPFGLVVKHRTADAEQQARLPKAHLVFFFGIFTELPLFGRRQSFFSITSFKIVFCKVISATIFLYWESSFSISFIFLSWLTSMPEYLLFHW